MFYRLGMFLKNYLFLRKVGNFWLIKGHPFMTFTLRRRRFKKRKLKKDAIS